MTTFHYKWVWNLKSSPAALWPLVTNTDRFNAAAGVPSITFTETPLPEGLSRRTMTQRFYGVPVKYDEDPFQWVHGQQMSRVSRYHASPFTPMKDFRMQMTLEPHDDGGTRLIYESWTSAATVVGLVAIPIQINGLFRRRFGAVFRKIDQNLQKQSQQFPERIVQTPLTSEGRARIRDAAKVLFEAKQDPTIVNALVLHLEKAPDSEVFRMRPYALADRWGFDRQKTLEVFLRATRAGLIDLSWDMLCPDCRGAKHRSVSLEGITRYGYCPSCNLDFEVDFARSVEVSFQVNPAIRSAVHQDFCIGNPQLTPHILAQQRLEPGETRTLTIRLEPGRYRWLAPEIANRAKTPRTLEALESALKGQALFTVANNATTNAAEMTIQDELMLLDTPLAPGNIQFTITNKSERAEILRLGRLDWIDAAATAAEVTSLQVFRDLFSSDSLRPGQSISVSSLTLLFTDLKGSTSMYRTFGDAAVFGQVMDHFDILRDAVSKYRGGLVKTIGDAIMATFPDPADAVRAAIDIQREMGRYNTEKGSSLTLKIGINSGPCIAVTLNDKLDYFGSMVNLAARLEGLGKGDDVILADVVAHDPAVAALLQQSDLTVAPFEATVKGFSTPVSVVRVQVNPVGEKSASLA
jgi:class 3 adenylate cyclase